MPEFYSKYFLLLLLLVPFLLWYFEKKVRFRKPVLPVPSSHISAGLKKTIRYYLYRYEYVITIMIFILLVLALARPRSGFRQQTVHTEGIDIVLVMDISTSMRAMDFDPNRLEAAKKIAIDFVNQRYSDRIGVVSFARVSFTLVPLTIDYEVIRKSLSGVKFASENIDGTAIGNAIATAVDRLKSSEARSKVIILLTDGVNNAGEIDPRTAARLAKAFGIKIYTIGAGTKGEANYPVQTPFGERMMKVRVELDEDLLSEIADMTGGKYFRATDNKTLKEIYDTINQLEKTRLEVKEFTRYREWFHYFVIAALVIYLIKLFMNLVWLKPFPE